MNPGRLCTSQCAASRLIQNSGSSVGEGRVRERKHDSGKPAVLIAGGDGPKENPGCEASKTAVERCTQDGGRRGAKLRRPRSKFGDRKLLLQVEGNGRSVIRRWPLLLRG